MKEITRRDTCRAQAIAVTGLIELLMSDLADNPPEDFTEEDIARHREVARKARENRNELMGLSEKGGGQ